MARQPNQLCTIDLRLLGKIIRSQTDSKNLGPADDAYFAEGMTDEISSRLAGVPVLDQIVADFRDDDRFTGKAQRNDSGPIPRSSGSRQTQSSSPERR